MKKVLVTLLLIAATGTLVADDALVLPTGMWRFYIVPTYTTISGSYDADGKYQEKVDEGDAYTVFNLGLALEYGINPWLTAGLQWAPGMTLSSGIVNPVSNSYEKAHLNDSYDMIAGVKLQLLGDSGIVKSKHTRLAFSLGAKIPLSSPDWEAQAQNAAADKDYLASPADKHLLAPLFRFHADIVFSKQFFVNLYVQYVTYPGTKKLSETGLTGYSTVAGGADDADVKYGDQLFVELDPHFDTQLSKSMRFGIYLPLRYGWINETKTGGTGDGANGYYLTLNPTLDLFLTGTPFPLEFKLAWNMPLSGENSSVANTLMFMIRAYFKFW